MGVIVLKLEGPMQSWGTYSNFTERDTGTEPSKSGVIGLLCAALGRSRQTALDDLCALRMSVVVLREGRMANDFHTALDVPKSDRSKLGTVISNRHYLADASFLVFLEGENRLLEELIMALKNPRFAIYLGRKSFTPSAPVLLSDKIWSEEVEQVMMETLLVESKDRMAKARAIVECGLGEGEPRMDVPLSFAERRFGVRYVRNRWLDIDPMEVGE